MLVIKTPDSSGVFIYRPKSYHLSSNATVDVIHDFVPHVRNNFNLMIGLVSANIRRNSD